MWNKPREVLMYKTSPIGTISKIVGYISNPTDGGPNVREVLWDDCLKTFVDVMTAKSVDIDSWTFPPDAIIAMKLTNHSES